MEQRQKPIVGAVYGVYVEELKKYGAYQILEVFKGSVCYITLDYLESEPPGDYIFCGVCPPVTDKSCGNYGGDKWGMGQSFKRFLP